MADTAEDRRDASASPDETSGPDLEVPRDRPHRSFWKELPVLVVIAFAIALIIKTFLLQAFFIPSASMEPTLVVGDRVLVEMLSTRFGADDRGQVVVFEKDVVALVNPE
ncbi:MAG: S26 family signal peptidase, partial [Actinomycetota bacterium]|nr:S26 family signal peptidase [Actinomycetota bacterium]